MAVSPGGGGCGVVGSSVVGGGGLVSVGGGTGVVVGTTKVGVAGGGATIVCDGARDGTPVRVGLERRVDVGAISVLIGFRK